MKSHQCPARKISKMTLVMKPWGHEEIWAHTDDYVGKILVIKPDQKLSRQYHVVKDETIYVLQGVLTLEIGSDKDIEVMKLKRGDTFHVTPETVHRFCNLGTENLHLIEVSTPELADVVRIEDDYGRGHA